MLPQPLCNRSEVLIYTRQLLQSSVIRARRCSQSESGRWNDECQSRHESSYDLRGVSHIRRVCEYTPFLTTDVDFMTIEILLR